MTAAELATLREQALIAFRTDASYAVLMCRTATTIVHKRRSSHSRRLPAAKAVPPPTEVRCV
jgi:hypothetical protein